MKVESKPNIDVGEYVNNESHVDLMGRRLVPIATGEMPAHSFSVGCHLKRRSVRVAGLWFAGNLAFS